jgi:hypothetical protein
MLLRLQIAAATGRDLGVALAGLCAMNMALMAEHPVPPLYQSGVRYRRERPDTWSTVDIVLARGVGDCEDLTAYRVAELRLTGEDPGARGEVVEVRPRKWHARVRRSDGSVEDPSAKLGMHRRRRT